MASQFAPLVEYRDAQNIVWPAITDLDTLESYFLQDYSKGLYVVMLGPQSRKYATVFELLVEICLDFEEKYGSPVPSVHDAHLREAFSNVWIPSGVPSFVPAALQEIVMLHSQKRLWLENGDSRDWILPSLGPRLKTPPPTRRTPIPMPTTPPPTPTKPTPLPPIFTPLPPRPTPVTPSVPTVFVPTPKKFPTPKRGANVDLVEYHKIFKTEAIVKQYTDMIERLLTEPSHRVVRDTEWTSFPGTLAKITCDGLIMDLNQLEGYLPYIAQAFSEPVYAKFLDMMASLQLDASGIIKATSLVGDTKRPSFVGSSIGAPEDFIVKSLPVLLALYGRVEKNVYLIDPATKARTHHKEVQLAALYEHMKKHTNAPDEPSLLDWLFHIYGDSLPTIRDVVDYACAAPGTSSKCFIQDALQWNPDPNPVAPSMTWRDLIDTHAAWTPAGAAAKPMVPALFWESSFGAGMTVKRERDMQVCLAMATVVMFDDVFKRTPVASYAPQKLFDTAYGVLLMKLLYMLHTSEPAEEATRRVEVFTLNELCDTIDSTSPWWQIFRDALELSVYIRMLCYHRKLREIGAEIKLKVSDNTHEINLDEEVALPMHVTPQPSTWGIRDWDSLTDAAKANRAVQAISSKMKNLTSKSSKNIFPKTYAIDLFRKAFADVYADQTVALTGGSTATIAGGTGLPADVTIVDLDSQIVTDTKNPLFNISAPFAHVEMEHHTLGEDAVPAVPAAAPTVIVAPKPVVAHPAATRAASPAKTAPAPAPAAVVAAPKPVAMTMQPPAAAPVSTTTTTIRKLSAVVVQDPAEYENIVANWKKTVSGFNAIPDTQKPQIFVRAVQALYGNAATLKHAQHDIRAEVSAMYKAIPQSAVTASTTTAHQMFLRSHDNS